MVYICLDFMKCNHGLKTLLRHSWRESILTYFNKSRTARPISTTKTKRRKFRVSTWNQIGDLSHSLDGILIPLKVWGSIPVWELEFFPLFSDYSIRQYSFSSYSWTTTKMIQKIQKQVLSSNVRKRFIIKAQPLVINETLTLERNEYSSKTKD